MLNARAAGKSKTVCISAPALTDLLINAPKRSGEKFRAKFGEKSLLGENLRGAISSACGLRPTCDTRSFVVEAELDMCATNFTFVTLFMLRKMTRIELGRPRNFSKQKKNMKN